MNYQYKCNNCGNKFIFSIEWNNLELSIDAHKVFSTVKCPECKSMNTTKQVNKKEKDGG
jgi:DNA-directed RNA polymerase subunit RPC12/RpoP